METAFLHLTGVLEIDELYVFFSWAVEVNAVVDVERVAKSERCVEVGKRTKVKEVMHESSSSRTKKMIRCKICTYEGKRI